MLSDFSMTASCPRGVNQLRLFPRTVQCYVIVGVNREG